MKPLKRKNAIKKDNVFKPLFRSAFRERKKLKAQTFTAMIPNITTLMALCCGMTAIRFALLEKWDYAIVSILIAAVLDALDGRLARLLKSTSRFGAELDSFSDFLSFGVAPALIMYLKTLHTWGEIGWVISLFFSMCMVLRLARFNVANIDENQPQWMLGFFTGVPAPLGGFLGLFPLILTITFPHIPLFSSTGFCAIVMVVVGSLMISRIPTFSLKKVVIPPSYVMPFLIMLFVLVSLLYSFPWKTLTVLGFIYLCTIPLSIKSFRAHKKMDTQSKIAE